MEAKFVAYYRVSTKRQGESGLGLEAQREAVLQYLNGGSWILVEEFTEVESGKRNDRPQLEAALEACRLYGAKLVIAKLDRLSRDAHFLMGLQKAGVEFVAVDMPDANSFTVGIMALVAQQEREAISARTKAALAAAKARGVKLGGDRGYVPTAEARDKAKIAIQSGAQDFYSRIHKALDRLCPDGSLRDKAQALNDAGIPTRRGGKWQAPQVKRVLGWGKRLK